MALITKMIRLSVFTVAAMGVIALAGASDILAGEDSEMNDPEYLISDDPEMAKLPFSEAVRHGDTLYLSGQIGTGAGDKLVPGGIKAEARQMMENIRATLSRHGSSMDRVIKCTVFLADMSEWQAFNEVYVSFFEAGRLPARSALGASGLALDARVEMECIAAVDT